MKAFHVTIAKVGETLFEGEADSLTLPAEEGVMTVLANHEAFVTPLKPGEVRVVTPEGDHQEFLVLTGGVAEISMNQATVLL